MTFYYETGDTTKFNDYYKITINGKYMYLVNDFLEQFILELLKEKLADDRILIQNEYDIGFRIKKQNNKTVIRYYELDVPQTSLRSVEIKYKDIHIFRSFNTFYICKPQNCVMQLNISR